MGFGPLAFVGVESPQPLQFVLIRNDGYTKVTVHDKKNNLLKNKV